MCRIGTTAPPAPNWLLRHPLVVCLPVQAALLFTDLGRLPVWGDEQNSLVRAAMSVAQLVRSIEVDVHPPLYFLLLRAWLTLFGQEGSIVAARALSACIVLAATVVVDRYWFSRADPRTRAWCLALWTLSPILLLYGRMARGYALQLLLAALALEFGRRYAVRPTPRRLLAYAAPATLLLYTHYLPAIAVVTAVTLVMLVRSVRERSRRGLVALLASTAVIALALMPWSARFVYALGRVGAATPYRLLANTWLDAGAALGFAYVAFTVGESVQLWTIAAAGLLAIPIAVLVLRGAFEGPSWLPFVAPAAVVAFAGAHRWVSYAFVAGRLLFLLPFYLAALAGGGRALPRLRAGVGAALLVSSVAGIAGYFTQTGFLNKAYVIPVARISAAIRAAPDADSALIIVDHQSSNLNAVRHDFGARAVELIDRPSAEGIVRLARQHAGPVWFVHGTHDVSPERLNHLVEAALARDFTLARTGFAPYSDFDRWLMGVAGWSERPTHAVELIEMRRRTRP